MRWIAGCVAVALAVPSGALASSSGNLNVVVSGVGTSSGVFELAEGAWLETRGALPSQPDVTRPDEGIGHSSVVFGPGADDDDLSIQSDAEGAAIVIESLDVTESPLRLAFVSSSARANGCQIPDCGRYERDVQLSGPEPMRESGPGRHAWYWFDAGRYRVNSLAPAGASVTARIEFKSEAGSIVLVNDSPNRTLALNEPGQGRLFHEQGEALEQGAIDGTRVSEISQDSIGVASLASFRRQSDHPAHEATPIAALEFQDYPTSFWSSRKTYNLFLTSYIRMPLIPGTVTMRWSLAALELDRRFAAWMLIFPE